MYNYDVYYVALQPLQFQPQPAIDDPDGSNLPDSVVSSTRSAAPSLGISFPRKESTFSMTEPGPVVDPSAAGVNSVASRYDHN